jgi:hypothetical protein
MGILERTGVLDRYKVSPTQGTTGLLTGAQQPMSPFAQQAARNIGGALGMDMRTGQEKLTQALAQVDPNSPDAEAQQLAALVKFGTPAQQVQATQRLTALREKKEAKEDKTDLVVNMVAKKYGEREDVDDLVQLASQGAGISDIDALVKTNAMSGAERYTPVGKNIFDRQLGQFLVGPDNAKKEYQKVTFTDPKTEEEVTQFVNKADPTDIVREIRSVAPVGELGVQAQIQLREANKEYKDASSRAGSANRLATNLEQLTKPISSGFRAQVEESIKGFLGEQDLVTLLRTEAQALRIGTAVANLPPGPASDKDVALVLSGTLDANANPKTLAQYARGLAKLAQMESRYHSDQAAWINKYKDVGGYLDHVTLRNYNDKIAYINDEFNQDIPAGFSSFTDYALALSSKQNLTPEEQVELVDLEAFLGESVADIFKRRDAAERRLKESKRDKF